jgi:hypothetical protein
MTTVISGSSPSITFSDATTQTTALSAYRQAPRDITEQSNPANITWPVLPT